MKVKVKVKIKIRKKKKKRRTLVVERSKLIYFTGLRISLNLLIS